MVKKGNKKGRSENDDGIVEKEIDLKELQRQEQKNGGSKAGNAGKKNRFGSLPAKKAKEDQPRKAERSQEKVTREEEQRLLTQQKYDEKKKREEKEAKDKAYQEKMQKKEQKQKQKEQMLEQKQKKKQQGGQLSYREIEQQKKNKEMLQIVLLLTVFCMFMGAMKYFEESWARYGRHRNQEGFKDLYEILQVDASVSQQDIKKQYKKLAVIYHPDKNTNCTHCEEKFQEIVKAYEVLNNPQKRKHYDTTAGTMAPIKSMATELTDSNFERLVEEGSDVWIIQVYADGDSSSESFADQWESVVREYQGTIRFGRINKEYQQYAVSKLPINVVLLPTVLALTPELDASLLQMEYEENSVVALKKLVEEQIDSQVVRATDEDIESTIEQNKDKPGLLTLLKSNTVPSYMSYNSDMIHDILFMVNSPGYYNKIQQKHKLTDNGVFFYPEKFHSHKKQFQFKLSGVKTFKKEFDIALDLAKFLTVPEINRNNFNRYCEKVSIINQENEAQEDLMDESICVILLQQKDQKKQNSIQEKVFDFQMNHIQDIENQVKEHQNMFGDSVAKYQIVSSQLSKNKKLKEIVTSHAATNNLNQDDIVAIALHTTHRQISFLNNFLMLDDWLEDLVDSRERIDFQPLSEFGVSENENLGVLFYNPLSTPFNVVYKKVRNNVWNSKTLLTTVLLLVGLSYTKKDISGQNLIIFVVAIQGIAISILTGLQVYQELVQ